MKTLDPEQWRIIGRLITLCGDRARLSEILKSQEVSPESVTELAERGLIAAKLNGDDIDLTPGLIKTYRRSVYLRLSNAGESYYWNDPHRVLRSLGKAHHGLSLSYLLGMIVFDDVAELHRQGLVHALTEDTTVDLDSARQRWADSPVLVLPGGGEVFTNAVMVRTTKTGQRYSDL